jgi:hypothetical protein
MADNASSWLDFAQRSREDGGLGLAPHQAAGLVGNLANESGSDLSPWGPTGDNGTAWGTAQWRNERLDGLKQHAQENGLDYRTPEAQQAWMRREFDTTHNGAYKALLASTTPEEAANVVNRQYEVSADRSGRRENTARAIFTDGPTAIDQAMGRRPSTGSKAMAFSGDDEDKPALRPQIPPGALNGATTQPGWLEILGQTLKDMAPGIAQDPDHAKVLEAVAAGSRKVAADNGTWSTNYDPRTGLATQTNSKNPMLTRQFKYAEPKEEKDPVLQAAQVGRVKAMQDLSDEIAKNGAASRAALDSMAPTQQALSNPDVPQGLAGEALHMKNKALLLVPGYDTPELRKTVADTETAKSGINKMVQEGRTLNGGMPGSLSDKDLVFLKEAQAGLQNTPQGNQRILDIYKQLHNRRIEMDSARQSYLSDTSAHPLGLDEGFRKGLNDKWEKENAARDKTLTEKSSPAQSFEMKTPSGVQWKRNN